MVKHLHRHPRALQFPQRQERLQHAPGLVLTPQERSQRVDHRQVHSVHPVDRQHAVDQFQPFLLRGDGAERLGDEADAVTELVPPGPLGPQRHGLLADDDGLSRPDGQPPKHAACDAQTQEGAQQRRFA